VIDFDRVFLETSGLADPAPVLHSLASDGLLGAQYRLNGVVTLVDAVNGMTSLDTMPEAAKQAALADRLVITKTDIADADAVRRLRERLREMNPCALVHRHRRRTGPESVARDHAEQRKGPRPGTEPLANERGGRGCGTGVERKRWLSGGGRAAPVSMENGGSVAAGAAAAPGENGSYLRGRIAPRAGAHDAAIRSFCLWFDSPFTWDTLSASLQVLTLRCTARTCCASRALSMSKARRGRWSSTACSTFSSAAGSERWHDADRRSRIVFIVRNIPRKSIEALFGAVGMLEKPGS
jgi:G3E family GTPase